MWLAFSWILSGLRKGLAPLMGCLLLSCLFFPIHIPLSSFLSPSLPFLLPFSASSLRSSLLLSPSFSSDFLFLSPLFSSLFPPPLSPSFPSTPFPSCYVSQTGHNLMIFLPQPQARISQICTLPFKSSRKPGTNSFA